MAEILSFNFGALGADLRAARRGRQRNPRGLPESVRAIYDEIGRKATDRILLSVNPKVVKGMKSRYATAILHFASSNTARKVVQLDPPGVGSHQGAGQAGQERLPAGLQGLHRDLPRRCRPWWHGIEHRAVQAQQGDPGPHPPSADARYQCRGLLHGPDTRDRQGHQEVAQEGLPLRGAPERHQRHRLGEHPGDGEQGPDSLRRQAVRLEDPPWQASQHHVGVPQDHLLRLHQGHQALRGLGQRQTAQELLPDFQSQRAATQSAHRSRATAQQGRQCCGPLQHTAHGPRQRASATEDPDH